MSEIVAVPNPACAVDQAAKEQPHLDCCQMFGCAQTFKLWSWAPARSDKAQHKISEMASCWPKG